MKFYERGAANIGPIGAGGEVLRFLIRPFGFEDAGFLVQVTSPRIVRKKSSCFSSPGSVSAIHSVASVIPVGSISAFSWMKHSRSRGNAG